MEVNMRKRFDFSVSELRYSLLEFNSRKNSLTFDKLNEMEYEFETARIHCLCDVFAAVAVKAR